MNELSEFDLHVLTGIKAGAKTWYSIERYLARNGIIPPVRLPECLKNLEDKGLIQLSNEENSPNQYWQITSCGLNLLQTE